MTTLASTDCAVAEMANIGSPDIEVSYSLDTSTSSDASTVELTPSIPTAMSRYGQSYLKNYSYYGSEEEDPFGPTSGSYADDEEEVRVDDSLIVRLQQSDIIFDDDVCSLSSIPHADTHDTDIVGCLSMEEEESLPVGEAHCVLNRCSSRVSDAPLHEAHVVVDDTVEVSKSRTEFISVTLVRRDNGKKENKSAAATLGIKFRRSKKKLRISHIDENGLFANTHLMKGDEVMSINDVSCKRIGSKSAKYLIARKWKKSCYCNIVVRNKGGDAGLVTNTVMKPSRNSLVGLGLKRISGTIRVSSVECDGLFNHSLLEVGHRCLFINDVSCANTSLSHAAEVVLRAKDHVTIVSRPSEGLAMVVSANPKRWWQIKGARMMKGVQKTISKL